MPYKDPAKKRAHNSSYKAKNKTKISGQQKAYYAQTAERQKADAKRRKAANPEKTKAAQRAHNLKYNYGITPADYDAMLTAQDFKCAICLTSTPGGNGFHVDHCHTTGTVRGLLCVNCNTGLGNFRDNRAALARAIDYLGNS